MGGLATSAAAQDPAHAISLFEFGGASGYSPGAGVITDRRGTIFGTTSIGGNGPCLGGAGCGMVFALSPPSAHGAPWAYNVLYNFQGGQDGGSPSAQLTTDDVGALYGYATDGTWGTVFRLLPPEQDGGAWTFQILYVFTNQADGNLEAEYSPLILHRGALIGTVEGDFDFFAGNVFKLTPPEDGGAWTYTRLWNFNLGPDRNPLNVVTGRGEICSERCRAEIPQTDRCSNSNCTEFAEAAQCQGVTPDPSLKKPTPAES